MATAKKKQNSQMNFNADVARLLDIVANALYTNHDVFLRELISNASDACDKLRYEAIQKPDLTKDNPNFRIHIKPDSAARTLTIIDNGIGMSKKELIDNLGTIAKSGTAALMEQLKQSKNENNPNLIGQFGVGFYASYMVASHVRVISRKADAKAINVWSSDGATGFDVAKATAEEAALLDGERGTAIILDLKDEGSDFLLEEKIKQTINQYSNHIDVKVFLGASKDTDNGEGQPINQAGAIWARSKGDVTEEEHTQFYQSLSFGFDGPALTLHWRAEGMIEFNALLYVPSMRPLDLYDPGRKGGVKLYVRRVFISDSAEGLTYPWLRFVRGVIDSSDLPLNISRESLQFNPIIAKIRKATTNKVLNELDKFSRNDEESYNIFWNNFGAALKEGLYDAPEHRDAIFKLCRFHSTHDGKTTSLADYVERMKEGQNEIYYLSGEDLSSIENSPQIEGFKARGLEVLFFTDTIDDFWLQQVTEFNGKTFKSVTKGNVDLDGFAKEKTDATEEKANKNNDIAPLLEKMKDILGDEVEDIRASNRLTDSPVCLIAPDGGIDMQMERVLKINQNYQGQTKPILEINPDHALIKVITQIHDGNDEEIRDAAYLLFDQAKIIQGQPVSNQADFTRRLSDFMLKALK